MEGPGPRPEPDPGVSGQRRARGWLSRADKQGGISAEPPDPCSFHICATLYVGQGLLLPL